MSRTQSTGKPWALGIDVHDCITAREVMQKAKLDFVVKKCELSARMPFTIGGDNTITENDELNGTFAHDGFIFRNCPNAYATYRTDKNIPLGLVKSKYEVVQNVDAFNFFDEAIGPDKALWEYAGCLGYGEQIYVAAKLPITTTVDGDPIENYLVFSNSHDGTSSVIIMFTPVRVFCTNMLNSALNNADSYIRIRHTESAGDKLHKGAEVLKIACEYAKDASELYSALNKVTMKDDDVLAYISNLFLTDTERTALLNYDNQRGYNRLINLEFIILQESKVSVRKANQIKEVYTYYHEGVGQNNIIGTAWGAYNAITGYYANVANLDGDKRFNSLLFGNGRNAMQKALISAYDIAKVA